MKCEYCGTVIPDGAEECPACGAGIKSQTESPAAEENIPAKVGLCCRDCGTINDPESYKCTNCGDSLKENCSESRRLICTSCGHRFEKTFEYVLLTGAIRTKISRGPDKDHRCDKTVDPDEPEFQIECQIKKTSCPECGGKVVEDPFSQCCSRQELIRYSWLWGWVPISLVKINVGIALGNFCLIAMFTMSLAQPLIRYNKENRFGDVFLCICFWFFFLFFSEILNVIVSHFIEKDEAGKPLFDENNWAQILSEYCGNVISDGAEAGPSCGAGIKQTESPAAGEKYTLKRRKQTEKQKKNWQAVCYAAGSFAAFVLFGISSNWVMAKHYADEVTRYWISEHPELKKAAEYMKNADLKYPTLKDAVMAARCADVKSLLLIRKNGFTNWKDPEIMLAACEMPILDNVRTIHRLGGNVNVNDKNGKTLLMHAAEWWLVGNLETVKYLVSQGADVKAKDKDGQTVLMWATRSSRNLETVKYLVSQGADVNAKTNNGLTALMLAAWVDNLETVKYLVSQSADVKAKDNYGETVLMYAAKEKDHLETVKYLVSQGADVNAKNNDGETVLDNADESYASYLRSVGARTGKTQRNSGGSK